MRVRLRLGGSGPWFCYLCQRAVRRRKLSSLLAKNFLFIVIFFICLHFVLKLLLSAAFTPKVPEFEDDLFVKTPFDDLVPSSSFDLFWSSWDADESSFLNRRLMAIDSLFIHHPQATFIMISSKLSDKRVFLPYRRRGYKAYCVNISVADLIQWHWHINDRVRDFLYNWTGKGTFFRKHLNDYVSEIALFVQGGTFLPMESIMLQPLPRVEFIGLDHLGPRDHCPWCIPNTANFYVQPSFMRFLPQAVILHDIIDSTFHAGVYNETCFNCQSIKAFTEYVIQNLNKSDDDPTSFKILEPYRLYPFKWNDIVSVFSTTPRDVALQAVDLMKRCYTLRCFSIETDQLAIAPGSLVDFLLDRFDLTNTRPKASGVEQVKESAQLIHPSVYVYTLRKQGRFLGRDAIYFRLDDTLVGENIKWNLEIQATSGTFTNLRYSTYTNLTQADVNIILNEMSYQPKNLTHMDRLYIAIKNDKMTIRVFFIVLNFPEWVTFVIESIDGVRHLTELDRIVGNIAKFYPETPIVVVSTVDGSSNATALNVTGAEIMHGYELNKTLIVVNVTQDFRINPHRNLVTNAIKTPYFFVVHDNYTITEHIHIDVFVEVMYSHSHIDILGGEITESNEDSMVTSDLLNDEHQEVRNLVSNNIGDDDDTPVVGRRFDPQESSPCYRMELVPDLFLAKRSRVESLGFDELFSLETSDILFERIDNTNRTIYSCRSIHNKPIQELWWRRGEEYQLRFVDVLH